MKYFRGIEIGLLFEMVNGSGWNAKGTTIGGCNYMFIYPYVTGELNMMVSGLHHGMRARNVYPEGLLFLSMPFNLLPGIIAALWEDVKALIKDEFIPLYGDGDYGKDDTIVCVKRFD